MISSIFKFSIGTLFLAFGLLISGCPVDSEDSRNRLNIRITEANDTLLTFDSLDIKVESKDGGFQQNILSGKLKDPAQLLNIALDKRVGDSFTIVIKGFNGNQQTLYKKIKVLDSQRSEERDLKDSLVVYASVPEILIKGDSTGFEGKEVRFTVSSSKLDPRIKGFFLKGQPPGSVLDTIGQPAGTSVFKWIPDFTQGREEPYLVTFGINMGGQSVERSVQVRVFHVNLPPKLKAIPSQKVDEGDVLQFKVEAEDPDPDIVFIDMEEAPLGATFSNDYFRWQPAAGQSGNYAVKFTAEDGKASDSIVVIISVGDVDLPPEITAATGIRDTLISEGQLLEKIFSASDPDGTPVSFTAKVLPLGSTFEILGPGTGKFSWKPSYRSGRHEPYLLEVNAASGGLSTTARISIEVRDTELQTLGAPQFTTQTTTSPTKVFRPSWEWTGTTAGTGNFRVRLDSGTFKETTEKKYSPQQDLSEGWHSLEVQEKNLDDNWSETALSRIHIDATLPVLSLTSHTAASIIRLTQTNKLVLKGTSTDSGGSGIAKVTYFVTGKSSVTSTSTLGSDSWSTPELVLANGGESVITLTAEDNVGHTRTMAITVQVNVPLPALSFISPTPPDNFVTNMPTIKVAWQVDDKVFSDESQALRIGENRIQREARNIAGDSVSAYFTVYRVDPSIAFVNATATGNDDGSSWKDAFKDLQKAMKTWDSLVPNQRQLWVAKGTYYPKGADTAGYVLNEGTRLLGGFSGTERAADSRGAAERSTLNGDGAYFIVKIRGKETLLDGFVVTGAIGAALSISEVDSAIIRNCSFQKNFSPGEGGAGHILNSKVIFSNCLFRENKAGVGGGLSIYSGDRISRFINSTFELNEANSGKDLYLVSYVGLKIATLENTKIDTTQLGIQGLDYAEYK